MQILVADKNDPIRYYLMAYPCSFNINDVNNPHYGTIDKYKVYAQYNEFINLLLSHNIKPWLLDIDPSTSQVFTRDLGFVINDLLFVSKMHNPERQKETRSLLKFIERFGLKHYVMQNFLEGGDVVYGDELLFIGVGGRTTPQAAAEVQAVLKEHKISLKVVPLRFDSNTKVHLDCTFNTLDRDHCVISDFVYDLDLIRRHIPNCIMLDYTTADNLGANYIYLGHKTVVTHSRSAQALLQAHGYTVHYTDYSEIVKANGSLRCSTLPILRTSAAN